MTYEQVEEIIFEMLDKHISRADLVRADIEWENFNFAEKLVSRLRQNGVNLPIPEPPPKFAMTSCSACGRQFGPGDHGFSHCENHAGKRALLPSEETYS